MKIIFRTFLYFPRRILIAVKLRWIKSAVKLRELTI